MRYSTIKDRMAQTDLSAYKNLYIKTAREYIAKMRTAHAQLVNQPDSTEAIESLFISVHSIKGQSQVMGYQQTGNLSSIVEMVYHEVKEGTKSITPQILEGSATAIDWIEKSLNSIESEGKEIELTVPIESVRSSLL